MNAGYVLLTVGCCVLPLAAFALGWLAHKRYERHGLSGLIPGGTHEQ